VRISIWPDSALQSRGVHPRLANARAVIVGLFAAKAYPIRQFRELSSVLGGNANEVAAIHSINWEVRVGARHFLTVDTLRGLSWFRVWVTSLEWSDPPLKGSPRREMGVTRAEQVQLV
jgi:hypothetical protein